MGNSSETSQEQQSEQPMVDPVDQKFHDFAIGLKENEIKQNTTDVKAKEGALSVATSMETGRKSTWEQAQRAHEEYSTIRERLVLQLVQANTEMKDNFTDAKAVLGTLDSNLTTALTSVRNVNKKMLVVLEALNNLDKVIKDHCNKSEFKALDRQSGLEDKAKKIGEKADAAYQQVCKLFDTAVKMAGVKAQLNLDPVDTRMGLVDTRVTGFSAKVEEALTAATSRRDSTRQAYDEAIETKVTAEDDLNIVHMVQRLAYNLVLKFTYSQRGRRERWTIDDIVEQVERNYAMPVPADDDEEATD